MTGRPWTVRLVLLTMMLSLLTSGVGWIEPALAAGPRFDPPLLPGLDIWRALEVQACLNPVFVAGPCFWAMW